MQKDNISLHSLGSLVQRQGILLAYLLCATLLCVTILIFLMLVLGAPFSDNVINSILTPILHLVIVATLFFFAGRIIVRRTGKVKFALLGGLLISFIYGLCAYSFIGMLISEYNVYMNCGTFFPSTHQICTLVEYYPFSLAIIRMAILVEALLLGWLMSWLGGWIEMHQRKRHFKNIDAQAF
ncbi:hypothetical protein [Ktedonospora formicarum]|uniref:hypothetical protein n=1 Tax=Ktedonospora formicarum TaxID=2778364 RepID=UPI001C690A8D|nr:hypothetical protein [Ktedonospora formicarum]